MRKKSNAEKNTAITVNYTVPWRLTNVKPLDHYRLEVEFVDGTHGFVEMKQQIMSKKAGVFAKIRDIKIFNQVYLDHGAVTWPGEIDLAPDAMHSEIKRNGTWTLK